MLQRAKDLGVTVFRTKLAVVWRSGPGTLKPVYSGVTLLPLYGLGPVTLLLYASVSSYEVVTVIGNPCPVSTQNCQSRVSVHPQAAYFKHTIAASRMGGAARVQAGALASWV